MNARTLTVRRPLLLGTLLYVTYLALWAFSSAFIVYLNFHLNEYLPVYVVKWVRPFLGLFLALVFAGGFPLTHRLRSLGPRLTEDDQPRLFESLRKIALKCGYRTPAAVRLTSDATISLSLPRMVDRGRKTVIEVGLPLFHLLTVSQMEAVLAHAMFFSNRKNRAALYMLQRARRSVQTAEIWDHPKNPLRFLCWFYRRSGRVCSWIAESIVYDYRLAGDQSVARAMGSDIWAGALTTIVENQLAFTDYMDNKLLPIVERGSHPPVLDGYRMYLEVAGKKTAARHDVEKPTLEQRLAAIQHLPAAGGNDSTPAVRCSMTFRSSRRSRSYRKCAPR